jgi:hypothetical protein
VYSVGTAVHNFDVGAVLRANPGTAGQFSNHHVSVEGWAFAGNDAIEVEVHGYGEQAPSGFRNCYSVTLRSRRIRSIRCPAR